MSLKTQGGETKVPSPALHEENVPRKLRIRNLQLKNNVRVQTTLSRLDTFWMGSKCLFKSNGHLKESEIKEQTLGIHFIEASFF